MSDQLRLVRSATIVLHQRPLHMDEGLKPRWVKACVFVRLKTTEQWSKL